MIKILKNLLFIFAVTYLISACNNNKNSIPKPQEPNENELITTLQLILKEKSDTTKITTAIFQDLDGEGGKQPTTFDTLRLHPSKIYNVTLLLLDESKNPVATISNEVKEEDDEHQLFYTVSGGAQVTFAYTDYDANKVPLGLKTTFTSGTATINKTGKVKVVLKHQGADKPKSGQGNASLGSTDIEIDFPVIIK